jgi:hypothetical protein
LPASSVTVSGSGNDADGTITAYQWSYISGPANYTITSPNTASTTITGLEEGVYVFRLTVTDDDNATGIQVNLYGGTNPYSNTAWNNWNVSSSLTSSALTWSNGTSSTVTAVLTASQGIGDNGSAYGGTMCPPEVLRYTSFATSNRTLTINNLDATATYDLEFYASRVTTGNATVFTIGSLSDTVVTDNNKTVTANFSAIAPDGNNKIIISLSRLTGSTYQYLNGFRLIKHGGQSFGRQVNNAMEKNRTMLSELTIYPNPARDLLYFHYAMQHTVKAQLEIYDLSGRVVKTVALNGSHSLFKQQLDIRSLRAGLYYISITGDDGDKLRSTFVKW